GRGARPRSAVAADSAAARAGFPPARGPTVLTTSRAIAASGPAITCRELAKSAYPSTAASAAYRPLAGGRPTRAPYAITEGTITTHPLPPPTRSPRSHSRRYPRSRPARGSALVHPPSARVVDGCSSRPIGLPGAATSGLPRVAGVRDEDHEQPGGRRGAGVLGEHVV